MFPFPFIPIQIERIKYSLFHSFSVLRKQFCPKIKNDTYSNQPSSEQQITKTHENRFSFSFSVSELLLLSISEQHKKKFYGSNCRWIVEKKKNFHWKKSFLQSKKICLQNSPGKYYNYFLRYFLRKIEVTALSTRSQKCISSRKGKTSHENR